MYSYQMDVDCTFKVQGFRARQLICHSSYSRTVLEAHGVNGMPFSIWSLASRQCACGKEQDTAAAILPNHHEHLKPTQPIFLIYCKLLVYRPLTYLSGILTAECLRARSCETIQTS